VWAQHADVAVPGRRRDQLEKVCRYILRPPLAVERLTESTGGQLLYHFRRPWRDGSTALGRPRLFVDPAGRVPGLISPTSRRLAGSSAARYTPPTAMTRRLTVMT